MINIINNKKYDTDKSIEIAEYSYSNPRDFKYFSETLYRSQKGQHYLYGEGGPASPYREEVGVRSWNNGSGAKLMTETEALEWCQLRDICSTTITEHFDSILQEG